MSAPFVVIGNPGNRRIELFQQALAKHSLPPATMISYLDLIAGRVTLPDVIQAGTILRIESPGRDSAVEQALLAVGANRVEAGSAQISQAEVSALLIEKGQILYPRQWYLGYCAILADIERQRQACPTHHLMNHPDDIAAMFDKRESHRRMQAAMITVPRSLGPIANYEELLAAMRREQCPRVFIKLAHGSSASGTVALQISQRQQQAISTVEMVEHPQGLRLYNTRRLRSYRDSAQIVRLIDALCQHVVHVEQWLPKAGINNQTFDLRVMVIDGRAQHTVVRMSNGPMTNLHLLNKRGDLQQVLEQIEPETWAAACEACVAAMNCFPNSLYAGIDLLIQPDFERYAILEINAFGDLLPGILYEEQDTYSAEIAASIAM